ncbi:S1 family peptidase [Paenibacillus planticolens]|uniref:Trypsin-like serine protease n=1 Tax=Paenibacillus planticolens TaxID=2654976 RepID=A0ABX1ZKT9_9BACL|nr:serine protease [Paenibacillus planticolens]NOV00591.1 trypsin-like serine protease [Paenibacillus planticolens]
MKRTGRAMILALMALFLFLGGFSITQADPPDKHDGESLYVSVEQAIFYVRVFRSDGTLKDVGTGFLIRSDGTALTADHVVKEADRIECVLNDASVVPCRTVVESDLQDTAVLKLSPLSDTSGTEQPFPFIPLRKNAVKHGEKVFAIGYPIKDTQIITEGIVNAPRAAINGRDRIMVSSQLVSGMSGGPLLDSFGFAAGILSGSLRTMNGIHLAVDTQAVMQVLEQDEH